MSKTVLLFGAVGSEANQHGATKFHLFSKGYGNFSIKKGVDT